MATMICEHVEEIREVEPSSDGCLECLQTGNDWVHLRLYLTCGHVECCDGPRNKHATKHFHKTHQPTIRSFEPGEDWRWCLIDKIVLS